MSSRRLVSRSRQNEEASPVQRNRQRRQEQEAPNEPTPLPPYEPPTCQLSASAKNAIDNLRLNHDYSKYQKHLTVAMKAITTAAADNHERLAVHKTQVQKYAEHRQSKDILDDQKPESHIEKEQYTHALEGNVLDLTTKAEKALRDLIDYSDELAMQDTVMKGVGEEIAAAPAAQPSVRRRQREPRADDEEGGEEELEDENIAPAADENILSAVELLKKAKEEYIARYTSKSMRDRYGDHNEYKNFKRTVHEAIHSGENAPPVPHASTWFPEDNPNESAGSRRRRNNTTDNTNNDDDEIQMTGVTINLKCPLTLQVFKEPYSNNKCSHTFEKSAFLDYFNHSATVFVQPNQRRGPQPQGEKQTKCPQSGCEKMLTLKDFFDDHLVLRRVQRAEKEAARANYDDEDEEDLRPRGTQRNRPTQIDDEEDSIDIDEEEERRKSIKKIKRERQRNSGLSMARAASSEAGEDEIEAMDTD